MIPSQYYVLNENTLCYQQEGSRLLGVLHGSVLKGGHDWRNGPVIPCRSDNIRTATLADFAEYRCQPPKDFAETQRSDAVARRWDG